jgi:hypothetical protein
MEREITHLQTNSFATKGQGWNMQPTPKSIWYQKPKASKIKVMNNKIIEEDENQRLEWELL